MIYVYSLTLTGGNVWALFEWPQYLIYAQALNSRAISWCKSTVLQSDWTPEKNKNEHIQTNRFRHDTNQQEVRPIGGFFAPRPQKAEKYLLCPKHKGHRTQLEPMGHSFVRAIQSLVLDLLKLWQQSKNPKQCTFLLFEQATRQKTRRLLECRQPPGSW